jgi:hypothetical protein
MVWQHIVLMHAVLIAGRQMDSMENDTNDVHKHDMLPHNFNEVFY